MITTLLILTLLAQGSGSTAPSGTSSPSLEDRPFVVTRSVDATLVEITKNVIVVKEMTKKGKERTFEVRLDARMQLSADKKTPLGQDKRKLSLEDFQPGQFVRLTWNPETGVAMALRALPERVVKSA